MITLPSNEAMAKSTDIRPCSVCGLFYPAEKSVLERDIDAMLANATVKKGTRRIAGIVAPHAGYLYSGPTAARGYAQLRGSRFSSVVVVSPSHREAFEGVSVYPGRGYGTPLGTITIDQDLRSRLLDASPDVVASEAGHRAEHAVEVQLPFLQRVLKYFLLLPLVIGNQSRETCLRLGEALASVLQGGDALIVASTDLSHYYPAAVAEKMDAVAIDHLTRFDYLRLMDDLEDGKTEACGGGPLVAVMAALARLGAPETEIMDHATSGDITGDVHSVVGYVSAVVYA